MFERVDNVDMSDFFNVCGRSNRYYMFNSGSLSLYEEGCNLANELYPACYGQELGKVSALIVDTADADVDRFHTTSWIHEDVCEH